MVHRHYRFEAILEGLSSILSEVGLRVDDLTTLDLRQNNGRAYRSYYCDRSRSLVSEAYSKDLEQFGYSF